MTATPLDPELAALLGDLPAITVDASTLPGMREMLGALAAPPLPTSVTVAEHVLPEGPILRVFHPRAGSAGARPALLWAHGGGYVFGHRAMDDHRLAGWVARFGCVAISVEYRLAPEHPYPAALDDCWASLRWVHDHADDLGIDPAAVGVGGLSAGGGLAAALALRARDEGGPAIAFQLLDSPMIDDRQATPSSRADDLVLWSRDANAFGWRSYLGGGDGDGDGYAAPARVTDLAGLPPTLVLAAGADGFRDEDVDYALRLSAAGVPTELHVYPGAPHGFTVFPCALADRAAADVERWLAGQLGRLGTSRPVGPPGDGHHLLDELGMRQVDDPEHGPALEMAVGPRVANPHGGLHGGLMMALIECGAAGLAVRAGGSENIVAGDLTVRFLSAVRQGPARVVGRVLRVGGRTITVQAEVIDVGEGRRVCAVASVSYARLDPS